MGDTVITALAYPKGNPGRVKVFLNGRFSFTLTRSLAEEARLSVGEFVSPQQVEALRGKDMLYACREAALRLFSYRPQSQKELAAKLGRRFDPEVVEQTLASLRGQGLVDDAAFARFWAENRQSHRPRGCRLLKTELKLKGVATEIVEETVKGLDDEEGAYRAGQKKARTLDGSDFAGFQRRLGNFLLRRGFGYQVSRLTVDRLWQEGQVGPVQVDEAGLSQAPLRRQAR